MGISVYVAYVLNVPKEEQASVSMCRTSIVPKKERVKVMISIHPY